MDRKTMKTVDMPKEFTSFTPTDQYYIKKFEKLNVNRATDMKTLRTRNKLTAFAIGGVAVGIYIYTLFSVKQEKFLDFEHDTSKESKRS